MYAVTVSERTSNNLNSISGSYVSLDQNLSFPSGSPGVTMMMWIKDDFASDDERETSIGFIAGIL